MVDVVGFGWKFKKFKLTPDPPVRPPAGSLFLFDRKALRYFRKDGHSWRKKKDGKTVREAHEKLKAGKVDVLHCYYAHGEDNENFQQRNILTALLIPCIFFSLPSIILAVFRGEIRKWIALNAVVLRLFLPRHFPVGNMDRSRISMLEEVKKIT